MINRRFVALALYIFYIINIFCLFYKTDRRFLAIFVTLGSSLFTIFVSKYINNEKK